MHTRCIEQQQQQQVLGDGGGGSRRLMAADDGDEGGDGGGSGSGGADRAGLDRAAGDSGTAGGAGLDVIGGGDSVESDPAGKLSEEAIESFEVFDEVGPLCKRSSRGCITSPHIPGRMRG